MTGELKKKVCPLTMFTDEPKYCYGSQCAAFRTMADNIDVCFFIEYLAVPISSYGQYLGSIKNQQNDEMYRKEIQ